MAIKMVAFDFLFKSAERASKQMKYERAIHKLEEGLAIFRRIQTDANVQKANNTQQIFNSHMTIKQYTGRDNKQTAEIKQRMKDCYSNLAGLYFLTKQYKDSIAAATYALQISQINQTALQIRARSLTSGSNYKAQDRQEALKDLKLTIRMSPFNPISHQLYEKLLSEHKIQQYTEKTAYGKMFGDSQDRVEKRKYQAKKEAMKSKIWKHLEETIFKDVQGELENQNDGKQNGGTGGTESQERRKEREQRDKKNSELQVVGEKQPDMVSLSNEENKEREGDKDVKIHDNPAKLQLDKKQQNQSIELKKKRKKKVDATNFYDQQIKKKQLQRFDKLIQSANEISAVFEQSGRTQDAKQMKQRFKQLQNYRQAYKNMFNFDPSRPDCLLYMFAHKKGQETSSLLTAPHQQQPPKIKHRDSSSYTAEIIPQILEEQAFQNQILLESEKAIKVLKQDSLKFIKDLRNQGKECSCENFASEKQIQKQMWVACGITLLCVIGFTIMNMFLF